MPRTSATSNHRTPTLRIVRPTTTERPAVQPKQVTYTKDELLKRFAPLVRHVVERVAATLPKNVDHEDLYSAGVLGLLDAHAKFDVGKGVKFETYAVWRIKGAVLDQLRALDWASRSMRRKARALDGVTQRLDQKLGRAATDHELAVKAAAIRTDFSRPGDVVLGYLPSLAPGSGAATRVRVAVTAATHARQIVAGYSRANCEVAARTAVRVGLGPGVECGLLDIYEQWDGKGGPRRIGGESHWRGMRPRML